MKLLIGLITIGFVLALNGCDTNFHKARFASLPEQDDQCAILSQKRNFRPHRTFVHRRAKRNLETDVARFSLRSFKKVPVVAYHLSLPIAVAVKPGLQLLDSVQENSSSTVVVEIQGRKPDWQTRYEIESNPSAISKPDQVLKSSSGKGMAISSRASAQTSWWFYGAAAIAGLCSMVGMTAFKKRSIKMANWATRNPLTSRGVIAATHVATGFAAFQGGHYLANTGLISNEFSAYVAMGVFGVAALTYPMKKVTHGFFRDGFLRRKMHDVALAVASLCLMFNLGQSVEATPFDLLSDSISRTSTTYLVDNSIDQTPPESRPVYEWPNSGKIVVTILLLALMGVAFYGVAILSCGLACNGYGFFAGLLLLGGATGLIAAFAGLMRRIFRHDKFLAKQKVRQERRAARRASRRASKSVVSLQVP